MGITGDCTAFMRSLCSTLGVIHLPAEIGKDYPPEAMKFTLDFTLTFGEWAEAFRTSNRSASRNRQFVGAMVTASVLAAIFLFGAMIYSPRLFESILAMFAPVLIAGILVWIVL